MCPDCHGRLMGLSPFEHRLSPGVGSRVWVGAASGSPAGPCPYCSKAMRRPDGDPDAAAGLAVCRTCQEVWIPASAADWMTAHAGPAPGPDGGHEAAPAPTECANCGAPYQPDEEGRCKWCQAQIGAPQPVVVLMQPAPASNWELRL